MGGRPSWRRWSGSSWRGFSCVANRVTIGTTNRGANGMGTLNIRIDEDLDHRLAREAEIAEQTRSELARDAIAAFLDQRERQRFLDEIARAARTDRSDALAIANEALPMDNEALELAERTLQQPAAPYRTGRKKR